MNAIEAGNFSVLIINKRGDAENITIEKTMAAKQTRVRSLVTTGLTRGYYQVHLYHNRKLAHLQELLA